MRSALLAVLLVVPSVAFAIPGKSDTKPRVMTAAQMMKFIEASPRTYAIEKPGAGEDDPAAVLGKLYPPRVKPVEDPVVRIVNGDRKIEPQPVGEKVIALLRRAETHFEKNDFEEADKIAAEAAVLEPKNYRVHLYRGDCAFFAKNPEGALKHYEQAAKLNPHDYRVHFYRGNAHAALGELKEMKRAFARALALKPRVETLVGRIRKDARLPFTLAEDMLKPRVAISKVSDEKVKVAVNPDDAHWLGFGLCKAMWMMEPERRREITGDSKHQLTMFEERECTASTLAIYEGFRTKMKTKRDAGLERAFAIARDGYLDELLIYELVSRSHEQVTLTLSSDELDRVAEMIEKHLFVPRQP